MRKAMGVAAVLAFGGFLLVFVLLIFGGSGSTQPLSSELATPEKTLEYATTSSKLGAPWEIVLLTDSAYAQRKGAGSVESTKPIHTALQFAILTVTEEIMQTVTGADGQPKTQWVAGNRNAYTGAGAIIAELGMDPAALDAMTPDDFIAAMIATVEGRSTPELRYKADLSANHNVESVLENYTSLTGEEIKQVLDLYKSGYLLDRLDDTTQTSVRQIMAANGLYQNLITGDYENCEGVIFTGGATEVTYYNQLDERWANAPYGTDQIGPCGCGPTSMAIVVSSLTDQTTDPIYMAAWAYQNGYWAKDAGSYHSLIPGAASAFGLTCTGSSDPQQIVDALSSGGLVVALMGQGHFTSCGHFMVLRGVTTDGKILVADPSSYSRSQTEWDLSLIMSEAIHSAGAGGPFWIITK